MPFSWFRGKRVTVLGLGSFGGGAGATEFLCRHEAQVTVMDRRGAEALSRSIQRLEHLPVRWALGGHRDEDILRADLVIINPAVPRDAPVVDLCRQSGALLDTEMNLFFKYCRGRIAAVTGSNGKTTTTSLAAAMARTRWPSARAGGNLGRSLLPCVEEIREGEWVLLELSSFQLEDLSVLPHRPAISAVTNLSPNHLDRHGTYAAYLAAKREILRPGPHPNVAVLNGDDAVSREWGPDSARTVSLVGGASSEHLPDVLIDFEEGVVFTTFEQRKEPLFRRVDLRIPGDFNLRNAAMAARVALGMGVGRDEVQAALRGFEGVEHRLRRVAVAGGVEYYNDSVATTPESTIAALEALGPRVVLICGGASKGTSFDALARAVTERAVAVVLVGSTALEIEAALARAGCRHPIVHSRDLAQAVAHASALAKPGERVVLSPACASYDQFLNFEERGERFLEIVEDVARGRAASRAEPEAREPTGR